MEKKNTVLLTVIAVATLLVAVVGATFAYFTATSSADSMGTGSANVQTATKADTAQLYTTASFTDNDYYPGTINYASAIVSANKTTSTNTTTLDVTYSITGSVTIPAELGSDVEWTLYKTEGTANAINPIITADSCGASEHVGNGTGEGQNGIPVGETRYYQTCTKSTAFDDTTKVTTVATGTTSNASISDTGTLTTGAGTTGGEVVNYYLVVEYKNNGNQNAQQGQAISFALNAATATGTSATVAEP